MAGIHVDIPDIRSIRTELRLSQAELATYLGISVRSIQSCEEGWRLPGPAVLKSLLLLLIIHRHHAGLKDMTCWSQKKCPAAMREKCLVHRSGQGYLCWFLTGNQCELPTSRNWSEKLTRCQRCKVFQRLLQPKSHSVT